MKNTIARRSLCLFLAISLLMTFPALSGCFALVPVLVQEAHDRFSEPEYLPIDRIELPKEEEPEEDDNGLRDDRREVASYQIVDEHFVKECAEAVEALDGVVCQLDLNVTYPQLHGLDEAVEQKANEAIKHVAMRSVDRLYLNPNDVIKQFLKDESEKGNRPFTPPGVIIWSLVDCYVTYNDENMISIAFNDHYYIGSFYGEFIDARAITIDLTTGEEYRWTEAILEVDQSFVDKWLLRAWEVEDNTFFLKTQPREDFWAILTNDENYTNRYFTTFFVDDTDDICVLVTYHMGIDGKIARGWADVHFSVEELESYRTDSDFWQLLDRSIKEAKTNRSWPS